MVSLAKMTYKSVIFRWNFLQRIATNAAQAIMPNFSDRRWAGFKRWRDFPRVFLVGQRMLQYKKSCISFECRVLKKSYNQQFPLL